MTLQYPRIPLIAYSDRLSARPGEGVGFKVSCDGSAPVTVRVVRSISADPNPDGPGMIETPVASALDGQSFPPRRQAFNPGSFIRVPRGPAIGGVFSASVNVWPTLPGAREQVILSLGGVELALDGAGCPAVRAGEGTVSTGRPLKARHWYRLRLEADPATGHVHLAQTPLDIWDEPAEATATLPAFALDVDAPVLMAAGLRDGHPACHFNGKIEGPTIRDGERIVADWDFARDTPTTAIRDNGPGGHDGEVVNHPARGMTGAAWTGEEMCWRHRPEHYGAIHFHEDDIYDFGWDTDFTWEIPADLPSGIYAVRISDGTHEDAIPVFVCPPKGKRTADLAVLVSTFTYTVYGNNARLDWDPAWLDTMAKWNAYPWNPAEYPELGMSTYNFHSDGSGICHASHLRPLLTLRPGYLTYGHGNHSGLRHFQADSHLITFLHEKGIDYDIVTDRELHEEGADVLKGYRAVTTGSHPEYHTAETLDALTGYRDGGGNLMYLGGNGFYWRVAVHEQEPGMIEIRRAETGIRAWAAEAGEYYNAFDGAYGGLWRRNGRPPQQLAGVGFSAQGVFEGSYYRRTRASHDPDLAWIFEGVDDEILGDFGFSGGGAAGFELDRADLRLGSVDNIRVLASSEGHGPSFVLVFEDQLSHLATWPQRPMKELIRADMVWFEVPGGGQVFSTGSITFCGSLPWNGFDNNIARLLENVFRRFLA